MLFLIEHAHLHQLSFLVDDGIMQPLHAGRISHVVFHGIAVLLPQLASHAAEPCLLCHLGHSQFPQSLVISS